MVALVHRKKIYINFSKTKTKFCLSLHYNSDNNNFFVNGEEIYKFKASNEKNFWSQLCLERLSNKFDSNDLNEVSFNGNVYDFSVDYEAIDNNLNIHKYSMIKKSI